MDEIEAPEPCLLSVVALARSEAEHLQECLESLAPLLNALPSETLVVLDSRADPETRRVAGLVSNRTMISEFKSFPRQRNRGLESARGDWVFFIDPDERCTPELAAEIFETLSGSTSSAYRVPRRNFFFGREVRHTGWWPDYQIRLLRRDLCRYDETREVHELPICPGAPGTLRNPLVHFNYDTWSQFVVKQRSYAKYEARALFGAGRRARPRGFIGQPLRELKRRLLDWKGYLDGPLGILLSFAMAAYAFETYRQLWRLQRNTRR